MNIALILCVLLLLLPATVLAQGRKRAPARSTQSGKAQAVDELARTREDFIKATKEYKQTLEQLRALYQKELQRNEDKLAQAKELYAQGLLSKRDLEENERAVTVVKDKIAETGQQMKAADERVAEMLVEAQAMEQMAKAPPLLPGKLVQTTSYIRYNGLGAWSLNDAWKVQSFFLQRFGRQLPVSAFGQSAIHDRWGLDHRNAMDVGLNPDGAEGQALIAFLRSNGIPFSAFRNAIPGSATGPHIHIGRPSHRTGPVNP